MSRNSTIPDTAVLRKLLADEELSIKSAHEAGASGDAVVLRRTALIDRTLAGLHGSRAAAAPMPALVAVGGYGRGELNPHSDIDIMLLCGNEDERQQASPFLYRLWDMGLDIGYSVRTVDECIEIARTDLKVRTSLLESRLVAGDPHFFSSALQRLHAEVFNRRVPEFITEKLAERAAQRRKYGDSLYLREPNVKESSGGLRDFHTARWIACTRFRAASFEELASQGVITRAQLDGFLRSRNFLWRVRNELHYRSGRKNDQLTYDHQEGAAEAFRFRDSTHLLAVERFMKSYFLHARRVLEFSRMIGERSLPVRKPFWSGPARFLGPFTLLGRTVMPRSERLFQERPELLMQAIEIAHSRSVRLSEQLAGMVAGTRFGDSLRSSPEMARSFLAVLDRLEGLADTLTHMRDLRLLGRYLPEFRAIEALARHDFYHRYTVDEHILTAIRGLEDLWMGKLPSLGTLADAFRGLKKRWVLTLAVLLHDLGKAYRSDHEHRGRELAERILERMNVVGEDRERILFLIEHHLAMSVLSQRRELDDRKVIESFARTVGDRENLALLYLLTYADMTAVSPQAWTPWKSALLQDLYLRTKLYLADGELRQDAGPERDAGTVRLLREQCGGRFSGAQIDAFLAAMPAHYRATASAGRMLRHLDMVHRLPAEQLVIEHRQRTGRGITELTVCAYDAYGMFFRTAGTLAAQNLNIQRAQVFTARNGIMIDTFEVTDPAGSLVAHEEVWNAVKAELRDVLAGGKRPPEGRISAYERVLPGSVEASVSFDNETSGTLTIIDIAARDRVGLLYRVTKTLYDLNLDLASAKIVTEGIRVMDSFYVSDLLRQKITDPERLARIRERLIAVLEGERGARLS